VVNIPATISIGRQLRSSMNSDRSSDASGLRLTFESRRGFPANGRHAQHVDLLAQDRIFRFQPRSRLEESCQDAENQDRCKELRAQALYPSLLIEDISRRIAARPSLGHMQ
jgi:hypothetical protein